MRAVYCIRNQTNGKIYVGSAARVDWRWNQHRSLLRRGKHPNRYLQASWNKHGEAAFLFEVLEAVESAQQMEREQHFIDTLRACDRKVGYNSAPSASRHHFGLRHSAETKAKIRAKKMGVGKGEKRKPLTDAQKQNLSLKLKGRPIHSEEYKKRVGIESRARVRTPEWRSNISAAQKGKPRWSSEERERIKQQLTGRTQSETTKEKRRASMILFWERKKAL